jgi:myo-inositol-1-phosphate synthase
MNRVILILGVAGSGKDYVAKQMLETLPNAKMFKFADLIVDIASDIYSLNLRDPQVYEDFKKDRRFVLQNLGESLKTRVCPSIFTNDVARRIDEIMCEAEESEEHNYIISDCRYPGEIVLTEANLGAEDCEILCYFTDYHSERYNPNLEHKSEKFAQFLVKKGVSTGFVLPEVLSAYGEEFQKNGGEWI